MSNSSSFLLLRWLIDEKVSIMPFSSAKKGTKVYTGVFGEFKWSGKFYEAEVLKISGEKIESPVPKGAPGPQQDHMQLQLEACLYRLLDKQCTYSAI